MPVVPGRSLLLARVRARQWIPGLLRHHAEPRHGKEPGPGLPQTEQAQEPGERPMGGWPMAEQGLGPVLHDEPEAVQVQAAVLLEEGRLPLRKVVGHLRRQDRLPGLQEPVLALVQGPVLHGEQGPVRRRRAWCGGPVQPPVALEPPSGPVLLRQQERERYGREPVVRAALRSSSDDHVGTDLLLAEGHLRPEPVGFRLGFRRDHHRTQRGRCCRPLPGPCRRTYPSPSHQGF